MAFYYVSCSDVLSMAFYIDCSAACWPSSRRPRLSPIFGFRPRRIFTWQGCSLCTSRQPMVGLHNRMLQKCIPIEWVICCDIYFFKFYNLLIKCEIRQTSVFRNKTLFCYVLVHWIIYSMDSSTEWLGSNY